MRAKTGSRILPVVLSAIAFILLLSVAAPAVAQTVTSPAAATVWHRGETHDITWSGFTDNFVRIDLLLGATRVATLATATANSGTFTWRVPSNVKNGNQYQIRVTGVRSRQSALAGPFTIIGPTVTVTDPNGGEKWRSPSLQTITWSTSASGGSVTIELFKGSRKVTTIAIATPNDGSFDWNIPPNLKKGSDYRVRIVSNGTERPSDFSNSFFTLKPSAITVTSPNDSTVTWKRLGVYDVTWSSIGNTGSVVRIDLYNGSSRAMTITNSAPNTGSFGWSVPRETRPGSDYRVKVASVNLPSIFDSSDQPFTISSELLPGATLVCESPKGNPAATTAALVGNTEVAFSTASPGVLTVRCQFRVQAGSVASIFDKVRACIGTVDDSTLEWRNPTTGALSPWVGAATGVPSGGNAITGQAIYNNVTGFFEVDAVYTDLPTNNSGFGPKKIWGQVVVGSNVVGQTSQAIEVFFPRDEFNNPQWLYAPPGPNDGPNWFYYWKTDNIVAVDAAQMTNPITLPGWEFESDPTTYGFYYAGEDHINVCELAATDDPSSPFTLFHKETNRPLVLGANGLGPDMVAITVVHEFLHKWYYDTWAPLVAAAPFDLDPWGDLDDDGIPNGQEATAEGINSMPGDPDTYDMASYSPGYASYGDEEIRCRKREMTPTLGGITVDKTEDWAWPGTNSVPPYTGP